MEASTQRRSLEEVCPGSTLQVMRAIRWKAGVDRFEDGRAWRVG